MNGVASTSGASEEEIARKWLVRTAKREAVDVQSGYVFDILDRESDFRDKAYRAGLIRPFLLLATLPPRERVRLGMRLGVSLSRSSSYLDAHAEAWKLLREPMCGLQTRGGDVSRVVEKVTGVGRGANWLDILYSALTLGASTGKCPAMDPRELATLPIMRSPGHALFALRVAAHPAVNAYEVAALRLVSHAQRGRLAPASGVTLDAVCKHPSMDVLKSRLRRSYPRNVDEIARYTVTAAFASSPWASSSASRGTSPADVQIIADDVEEVVITGPGDRVDAAKTLVEKIIADSWVEGGAEGGSVTIVEEVVPCAYKAGAIIGPGGATIRQLRETTGVSIDIERGANGCKAGDQCRIIGTPAQVKKAVELVHQLLDEMNQVNMQAAPAVPPMYAYGYGAPYDPNAAAATIAPQMDPATYAAWQQYYAQLGYDPNAATNAYAQQSYQYPPQP